MGTWYLRGIRFVKYLRNKVKWREIPPRCWMCGEILPLPDETDPASMESKKRTGEEYARGSEGDE
jgi:hypothetical protein